VTIADLVISYMWKCCEKVHKREGTY